MALRKMSISLVMATLYQGFEICIVSRLHILSHSGLYSMQ